MIFNDQSGIIVQARTGSTRLPNKMTMPLYEGKSLMQIVLQNLKNQSRIPVFVATTVNPADDIICKISSEMGIEHYRGSEEDVLDRFIQTAQHFGLKYIIRVCADNPFFDVPSTLSLLNCCLMENVDYCGFSMINNIPSIKTHIGLWGEAVTYDALVKASFLTTKEIYREHVTNFIYTHPETFKIKLKEAPFNLSGRTDLRFTLDTIEDFTLHSNLIARFADEISNINTLALVNEVDSDPKLIEIMKSQILLNNK